MKSPERKTWESLLVFCMKNSNQPELVISGVGITSAIGQGKRKFSDALLAGNHNFSVMKRAGRQLPSNGEPEEVLPAPFLGAEIESLMMPDSIDKGLLRTASFSSQVAIASLHEAWEDAKLKDVAPERLGMVVGGSNFQQRELVLTQQKYHNRYQFLRPTYAMSYMDSDLCGLSTELFGIKGMAYTIGGASASGQLAVLQAAQAVLSGQVDTCIVIGALMDLSYWECQGFRSLGAMGSDQFATSPELACRPFDEKHDGFIYGENCGVLVIEKAQSINREGVDPYAYLSGWGMGMDANRNPNPSFDGEVNAVEKALNYAGLNAGDIDYVNPHGTGSTIGDETELESLNHCRLNHAYINATKSIVGHGLSAAGTVEVIATLLQMREKKLHPTRNLEDPISHDFNWVKQEATSHQINRAINLSMGFGGVNTAVCLQQY